MGRLNCLRTEEIVKCLYYDSCSKSVCFLFLSLSSKAARSSVKSSSHDNHIYFTTVINIMLCRGTTVLLYSRAV